MVDVSIINYQFAKFGFDESLAYFFDCVILNVTRAVSEPRTARCAITWGADWLSRLDGATASVGPMSAQDSASPRATGAGLPILRAKERRVVEWSRALVMRSSLE